MMEWLIPALIRARNSTLKRVRDLSEAELDLGGTDLVSIRDIACHIATCDNAVIRIFNPDLAYDDRIYPGLAGGRTREEVMRYLDEQLQKKCAVVAGNLDRLGEKTVHSTYGEITIGEAVLCSGIDHEAHHRGQIALIRKNNDI